MSLFFNMSFRFVIAFFPRSKHHLISWLRIYILMADLHFYTAKTWRRKWQPTPVFLTEKFHGQRSLVATGPRSCKVSDTTEHKAQQKSTQHCKVIILQLKVLKNILKIRKHPSALSHPVWQTLWVDVADAVWAHPYPFILLLSSSCQTPHASAYFQCPRLFASSQADGSVWDSNSPCIPQPRPTGCVITPTGTCYSGSQKCSKGMRLQLSKVIANLVTPSFMVWWLTLSVSLTGPRGTQTFS